MLVVNLPSGLRNVFPDTFWIDWIIRSISDRCYCLSFRSSLCLEEPSASFLDVHYRRLVVASVLALRWRVCILFFPVNVTKLWSLIGRCDIRLQCWYVHYKIILLIILIILLLIIIIIILRWRRFPQVILPRTQTNYKIMSIIWARLLLWKKVWIKYVAFKCSLFSYFYCAVSFAG